MISISNVQSSEASLETSELGSLIKAIIIINPIKAKIEVAIIYLLLSLNKFKVAIIPPKIFKTSTENP